MTATRPQELELNQPIDTKTVTAEASAALATTLADLNPGETGTVMELNPECGERLRLLEMGMTPGTEITLMHLAPLGGPLYIRMRGYHLSIRREQASCVRVTVSR